VGDEEGEVDRANPAPARKGDRTHLVMVYQIGHQKEARDPEGCDHADLVAGHLFPSDEEIPDREEYGARPVEKGVHSGEAGNRTTALELGLATQQNERHTQEDDNRDEPDAWENQPIFHIVITARPPLTAWDGPQFMPDGGAPPIA